MIKNSLPLTLHADATAKTLAAARVFILIVWMIKIACLDLVSLGHLPTELFHPFGIMKAMPVALIGFLTEPQTLLILKWSTLGLLALSCLGIGRRKPLIGAAILLTLCFGLTKGFGGHVNHRELILLYSTYLLAIVPCFEAFVFRKSNSPSSSTVDRKVFASSMQILCGIVLLNYFFVALARICVGFPGVFDPQVMYEWVLSRNVRPNPYGFTLGINLISTDLGRLILAAALPVSTVFELLAPICLWCNQKVRIAMVGLLASFHLGIFFTMNIAFFENVALLFLVLNYTPALETLLNRKRFAHPVSMTTQGAHS